MESQPHLARLLGDLAERAMDAAVKAAAAADPLAESAIAVRVKQLRAELVPATPLEALLVERILISWVQLHHLDKRLAAEDRASAEDAVESPESTLHFEKRVALASRRYLGAIKAFAQVRHLLDRAGRGERSITREVRVTERRSAT